MSKVSNAINMYYLLLVKGMMSAEELARELEVTTRMIKSYKKDLEMAGIYIESKPGRYGGYYIENGNGLGAINLTEDEISALKMACETIKSGKYHFSTKFEIIISKILNNKNDQTFYHNKLLRESDEVIEKEKSIWLDITKAINKKLKVKIKYKSLKQKGVEISERIINPYGVFNYKGATYTYVYCEKANDIRFFKLSRIVEYVISDETFDIKVEFNFDEILEKSFGIYNDELIQVKLKIYYPMSEIIKEKQIINGQIITQMDSKTICFEAEMKGYTEIKSWILSMGNLVEVMSPSNLKEEIYEEAKKMINMYK